MSQLSITVKSGSIARLNFITACAQYYARALNIAHYAWRVEIRSTSRLQCDHGCYGLVAQTAPRTITMLLSSQMSAYRLMVTLAHEMTHIKQIVRGQYSGVRSANGRTVGKWLGNIVRAKYRDRPWEIDARRRELPLAEGLLKKITAAH
jgi:hypothetical protein